MAAEPRWTVTRIPWAARIEPQIAARVRATVVGLQQAADPSFTASRFTEQALLSWCQRMEAEYNSGEVWPEAEGRLRPGARINP